MDELFLGALIGQRRNYHRENLMINDGLIDMKQSAEFYDLSLSRIQNWYKRDYLFNERCFESLIPYTQNHKHERRGAPAKIAFSGEQLARVVKEKVGYTPKVKVYTLSVQPVSTEKSFIIEYRWRYRELVCRKSLNFSIENLKKEVARYENIPLDLHTESLGENKYFYSPKKNDTVKGGFLSDEYWDYVMALRRYEFYYRDW